jgi:hypothetical protein
VPPGSPGHGSNVAALVVSADGGSLYAADDFNGRVVQYDRAANGQLTLKTPPFVTVPTPLRFGPDGLALSPDGESLYATTADGRIFQFDIDDGGQLAPKTPASLTFGSSGQDIAVAPDGRSAWATDFGTNGSGTTIAQFQVGSDGRLFPNTPATVTTAAAPTEAALTPDGDSLYVDHFGMNGAGTQVSQFDVTPTGTLAPKSPATINAGQGPGQPVLTPDGSNAYVPLAGTGGSPGSSVAQFDVSAGGLLAFKSPPTVASGQEPETAGVDGPGTSAYVGNIADLTVSQYSVGSGGGLSPKAEAPVFNNGFPGAIAIEPSAGPQAAFTTSVSGTTVSFDASASGPNIDDYDWNFGDGTELDDDGPTPTHVFPGPGPYVVTLSVEDVNGCETGGIWNGHQFVCTGAKADIRQVVDIPAPAGPPGPAGTGGAPGVTGPQGPAGAAPANRLAVALLFSRLHGRAGRPLTIPFFSSDFAGIVLELFDGGHRVARFQRYAQAGRNEVRWHSGHAAVGGYRVILKAVGLDGQRALDAASLGLRAAPRHTRHR